MERKVADLTSTAGLRLPSTFAALRHRNFRLWFLGQTLSMIGTWMQSVAQGWLVYDLTGSDFALGVISFIGTLPTLFLMLPAGALADRIPRRRVLLFTQTTMMLLAFILAILAATRVLRVWHVGVLAACLGIANSFEVYGGTHTSAVADRFQNHVLPFFSAHLCATRSCR